MNEDVEKKAHRDKDVVAGIRYGHARIPLFLKITYVGLLCWGAYYTITATTMNDREAVAAQPTAEQGQAIVQSRCAGCHSLGTEKVFGPGLQGVSKRLTADQIAQVLHNGRGQMPPPPSMGLTEDDLQSVQMFLETH
ncbi:MAG TPA: cytochrome c [Bacilli bacterium]|nr:cytochrome c [Bacilli bacterium]